MYVFQDSLCFYHEKNGYVYDVFQDRVTPRYKIDKGNYSAETPKEEFMHLKKYRGIAMQFPTEYLYFFFTPTRYAKLIEHIRSRLSEKEWEAYKEEHADLMKIYDGLDEDSNTIILGLKFK